MKYYSIVDYKNSKWNKKFKNEEKITKFYFSLKVQVLFHSVLLFFEKRKRNR
jgi:hypothetical protein